MKNKRENAQKRKMFFKHLKYNFIKYEGIQIIACFVCIILVAMNIYNREGEIKLEYIIDEKMFSTIVITAFLILLSKLIKNKLLVKIEDDIKLTPDYDKLVEQYADSAKDFVKYNNANKTSVKKFYKKQKCDLKKIEFTFPVIKDADLSDMQIVIKYVANKKYELPAFVQNAYEELMQSHHTELNYNNVLFRIDKWYIKGQEFIMETSKTTYFDSLVTNRAFDYKLYNGVSVRSIFENTSKLSNLEDSMLSNHLGFNGFIETSDGWVPFVKRSSNVSVGKNTYGNSVSASVKSKYVYEISQNFTFDGLVNSILHEISDELKISFDYLKERREDLKIIAAFRDVVEGGKPHVLFYMKLDITKQAIQENFRLRITKKDWTTQLTIDGKKLMWLTVDDLKSACIASNMLVSNNKVYKMTPSAAASVVMLIDYL